MRRVTHTSASLVEVVQSSLSEHGVAYVEGMPSEESLLAFAEKLGRITTPGVGMAAGMHDGRIYSVHVRHQGQVDRHGKVILSTTPLEFPLHTDAYNQPLPPRYVLLLRTDEGTDSTPSYVSDVAAVVGGLAEDTLAVLEQPSFPSARGPVALLQPDDTGGLRLRFNREEIDRWAPHREANPPMSPGSATALDELTRVLAAGRSTFVIQPHDCLVLDNWRVCHGRGAMRPDSTRTLKRVWVR